MLWLSRRLFRVVFSSFFKARTTKKAYVYHSQQPRTYLGTESLERRDVAGNMVNGLAAAAMGYNCSDPIQVMAAVFGDVALMNGGGWNTGATTSANSQTSNSANDPNNPIASGSQTPNVNFASFANQGGSSVTVDWGVLLSGLNDLAAGSNQAFALFNNSFYSGGTTSNPQSGSPYTVPPPETIPPYSPPPLGGTSPTSPPTIPPGVPPTGGPPMPPPTGTLNGSVQGRVYQDVNQNGTWSSNEPGISGVSVTLYRLNQTTGQLDFVTASLTQGDGQYAFNGLPSGTYTVSESTPAGFTDGSETVGSTGGQLLVNDVISSIPIVAGINPLLAVSTGNNFGEKLSSANQTASVSGKVYIDANSDGSLTSGENGIGGVVVSLLRNNPLTGFEVVTATQTDATGSYQFTSLAPNSYWVRETQPLSYADGSETPGSSQAFVAGNDLIGLGYLPAASSWPNNNFGELLSPPANAAFSIRPVADRSTLENDEIAESLSVRGNSSAQINWSATGLPHGVYIHPTTGRLEGTVGYGTAQATPYQVVIQASDGISTTTRSFTWTIRRLAIDPLDDLSLLEGEVVGITPNLRNPSGEPVVWTASGLPAGLSIDTKSGEISGTLATGSASSNPYSITVTARAGSFSNSASFAVRSSRVEVDSVETIQATVGEAVEMAMSARTSSTGAVSWSATCLPSGLSIHPTTGVISGTVTSTALTSTTLTSTVTATLGQDTGSTSILWNIDPFSIDDAAPQTSYLGRSESINLAGILGTNPGDTFSATGLPAGLIINSSTGVVSGTPTAITYTPEPVNVLVTVTRGAASRTTTINWFVDPFRFDTPVEEFDGAGDTVSKQLSTQHFANGTLSFTVSDLPPGLSFNPSTGAITGSLAATAIPGDVFRVSMTASDGGTRSITRVFDWKISNQRLILSPIANQTSSEGSNVDFTLSATDKLGYRLSYKATGLPDGVSLDGDTGRITGTVGGVAAGTYNVKVWVDNGQGSSAIGRFTWTVNAATQTPTLQVLANRRDAAGSIVSVPILASDPDGTTTTVTVSGLPAGVSYDSQTKSIRGTLTTSLTTPATVIVTVSDGTYSTTRSFEWAVRPFVLSTPDDQVSIEGSGSSSLQLYSTGAVANSLTWSAIGLPGGFSIHPSTGVISGTPSALASNTSQYSVTVTATNGTSTETMTFPWIVKYISIDPIAELVHSYSDEVFVQLAGSTPNNDALTWTATGLPSGLSLDTATGVISGTLDTTAGRPNPYIVNITATTASGHTATTTINWIVKPIRLTSLPNRVDQPNGVNFAAQATTNVPASITYTATGLPPGISINPSNGVISGLLTSASARQRAYPISVTASATVDGTLVSTAQDFDWEVTRIVVTADSRIAAVEGSRIDRAAGATGLTGTLSYTATGLPPGLTLNTSTGVISGWLTDGSGRSESYLTTLVISDGVDREMRTLEWEVQPLQLGDPRTQTVGVGDQVWLDVSSNVTTSNPIYSATGLPAGLTINTTTGRIQGTVAPSAYGSTVQTVVRVQREQAFAEQAINWVIIPFSVSTTAPQSTPEGTNVSLQPVSVVAPGTTLTWSATGLPTGLSINPSTGLISGTMGYQASNLGRQEVVLTVTGVNNAISFTRNFRFAWTPTYLRIDKPVDQTNIAGGTINLPVTGQSPVTTETLTWSATGLPPGLSINPTTGAITGTLSPTIVDGTRFEVTLTANTATHTTSEVFGWTVERVRLNQPKDQFANANEFVSIQLFSTATSGEAVTYSATNLPAGLTINPTTGVISGVATGAGADGTTVSITARSANGVSTRAFELNVANGSLAIPDLPDTSTRAESGLDYRLPLKINGETVAYTVAGLPTGLFFDPTTGIITGIIDPTVSGSYLVNIYGKTVNGNAKVDRLTISVADANTTPLLTTPTTRNTAVGTIVNYQLVGTDPDNTAIRITAYGLPPGLDINPVTGLITGTVKAKPGQTGSITYVVKAQAYDGAKEYETTFDWIVPLSGGSSPPPGGSSPPPGGSSPPPGGTSPPPGGTSPPPTSPPSGEAQISAQDGLVEGQTFIATGSFQGTANTAYSIVINWGDGTSNTIEQTSDANGNVTYHHEHKYVQDSAVAIERVDYPEPQSPRLKYHYGKYLITATASDSTGFSSISRFRVGVENDPVQIVGDVQKNPIIHYNGGSIAAITPIYFSGILKDKGLADRLLILTKAPGSNYGSEWFGWIGSGAGTTGTTETRPFSGANGHIITYPAGTTSAPLSFAYYDVNIELLSDPYTASPPGLPGLPGIPGVPPSGPGIPGSPPPYLPPIPSTPPIPPGMTGVDDPGAQIVVQSDILVSFYNESKQVIANPPTSTVDKIFKFFGDIGAQLYESVTLTLSRAQKYVQEAGQFFTDLEQSLRAAEQIITRVFNTHARRAIEAFLENPNVFLDNFFQAVSGGLNLYKDDLGDNLRDGLLAWIAPKFGLAPEEIKSLDFSDYKAVGGLLLKVLGLSVDDLLGVVAAKIGAGNTAVITAAYDFVAKAIEKNGPGAVFDAINDLGNMIGFNANQIWEKLEILKDGEIDPDKVLNVLMEQGIAALKESLPGLITSVVGKMVPGANVVKTVLDLAGWLKDNAVEVAGLVEEFAANFTNIFGDSDEGISRNLPLAEQGIRNGLKKATPAVLNLVVKLVGGTAADDIMKKLGDKLQSVGAKTKNKLGELIDKFAGAALTSLNKSMPKAANGATVGNPSADYQGLASSIVKWESNEGDSSPHIHRLWATVRGGKAQLWLASTPAELAGVIERWQIEAKKISDKPLADSILARITEVEKILYHDTPGNYKSVFGMRRMPGQKPLSIGEMGDVQKAIVELDRLLKECGNKPTTLAPALRKKLNEQIRMTREEKKQLSTVLKMLDRHIEFIQEGLAKACFAAGTKLWTPQGYRVIEEIGVGDSVFSRDEWNPAAPVEAKVVEEVFRRFARVLDLRVAGQVIRTTGEHPFYAAGLGWTPANELRSGMELLTATGEWVRVDGVDDTGEWEVVYNLRVADHHTYFVGDDTWGWNAWAHNKCSEDYYIYNDWVRGGFSVFEKNGNGQAVTLKSSSGTNVMLHAPDRKTLIGMLTGPNAVLSQSKVDTDPQLDDSNITSEALAEHFKQWLTKVASEKHSSKDQLGNTFGSVVGSPAVAPKIHAHHIVLKLGMNLIKPGEVLDGLPTSVRSFAQKTQKIIQQAGIDPIFGYQNLVWAPNWGGHGTISPSKSPLENPSKSYAKSVYDRLAAAVAEFGYTKTKIVDTLKKIATDFIGGSW